MPRGPTLAAGDDDGSNPALRGSFRRNLAAAIAGRNHTARRCGAGLVDGWRSSPKRFDHALRTSCARLPGVENVETLMVEPRSPDVFIVFCCGRALRGAALVETAG